MVLATVVGIVGLGTGVYAEQRWHLSEALRRAVARDGDIVVTADVPLAVRCVGAGALVTGPTGRVFDETNIGMASAMRDLSAHLRVTGESKGYNAALTSRDRSAFLETLDRLCRRVKR